jgi:hypothetical protein
MKQKSSSRTLAIMSEKNTQDDFRFRRFMNIRPTNDGLLDRPRRPLLRPIVSSPFVYVWQLPMTRLKDLALSRVSRSAFGKVTNQRAFEV